MLGKELVSKVLDDYRTAPISEKLRAMLAVLEKVTLRPDALEAADMAGLLGHGITEQMVIDALYVMYCFNIYPRLADSMGWALSSEAGYRAGAKMLLKRGYR